jgi:hypothetical protein
MTIEKAQKAKELLLLTEILAQKLANLNDVDIEILVCTRTKGGMYSGYPNEIKLKDLEIADKELINFLKSKIEEKIKMVELELHNL